MEQRRVDGLEAVFAAAGAAHHDATGGPDDAWADWYARWLDGRVEPLLGMRPGVERLSRWLIEADLRHRSVEPERPWPEAFAEYVLARAQEEGPVS
jgi:hypothetical protein